MRLTNLKISWLLWNSGGSQAQDRRGPCPFPALKKPATSKITLIITLIVLLLTAPPGQVAMSKTQARGDKKPVEKEVSRDEGKESLKGRNNENDETEKKDDGDDTDKHAGNKKGGDLKAGTKESHENDEKRAKYIQDTLDFGIQSDRLDALNKIKYVKDEALKKKIYDKIIKIIENDGDSEIKTKAIYVMNDHKVTDAVPAITKCLDDEDDDTVIAAAYALKNLKGTSAKDKLLSKLKEQDLSKSSNKTEAIIQTLSEFKAKEMLGTAMEAIKNPKTSKINKEAFILFLGNSESRDPKDLLLELYKNPDEEIIIRSYAVNSIAKLGLKETTPEILKVINEIDTYSFKKRTKYYTLYLYSISAMAMMGDESVIPKLLESLKSNNPQVRIKAVKLMRDLKDKRTIDILKYKMKYDPNARVRKEAESALKEIEEKEKKPKTGTGTNKQIDEKSQKTGDEKKSDGTGTKKTDQK